VNSKRAKAPRVTPHEIDPDALWTPHEAKRFLAYTSDADPDMAVLVRLALDSGARLGELLGLTWRDIDDKAATVTFRRSVSHKRMPGDTSRTRVDTPKSDKSRTVDVDVSTIAALLAMRDRQVDEPLADIAGIVFRRPSAEGFVRWRLDSTTHAFQRLSKEAKARRIAFHYLRHCCATWLLADGMDVVAVSKRLGHWSPALTLTVYAHAIPGRQQVLARAIGDALR
jgi:integrase